MDNITQEQRHRTMTCIRSGNTKPEMIVRKFLFASGFRYRLHKKELPGKPDIVLKKYKAVIFINGCFWHGHEGCRYAVIPKTHRNYWVPKILRNKERDAEEKAALIKLGWRVLTVWECSLKKNGKKEQTCLLIKKWIFSNETTRDI